jgi:uncharacterized protein YbjQ (UPF0145 family)
MIITTTSTIQNSSNIKYLGLVTGEATDLAMGVILGIENQLAKTRELAIEKITASAEAMGANAIIGVDIDFESINNVLVVAVTGTAIIAK